MSFTLEQQDLRVFAIFSAEEGRDAKSFSVSKGRGLPLSWHQPRGIYSE